MITHEEYIKRRDEILEKYAAYRDQYNREIEYDTTDNIDFDTAQQAIDELVLDVIGDDKDWRLAATNEYQQKIISDNNNLAKQRSIVKGEL